MPGFKKIETNYVEANGVLFAHLLDKTIEEMKPLCVNTLGEQEAQQEIIQRDLPRTCYISDQLSAQDIRDRILTNTTRHKKQKTLSYFQGDFDGRVVSENYLKSYYLKHSETEEELQQRTQEIHTLHFTYVNDNDEICGFAVSWNQNKNTFILTIIENSTAKPENRTVTSIISADILPLPLNFDANDEQNKLERLEQDDLQKAIQSSLKSEYVWILVKDLIQDGSVSNEAAAALEDRLCPGHNIDHYQRRIFEHIATFISNIDDNFLKGEFNLYKNQSERDPDFFKFEAFVEQVNDLLSAIESALESLDGSQQEAVNPFKKDMQQTLTAYQNELQAKINDQSNTMRKADQEAPQPQLVSPNQTFSQRHRATLGNSAAATLLVAAIAAAVSVFFPPFIFITISIAIAVTVGIATGAYFKILQDEQHEVNARASNNQTFESDYTEAPQAPELQALEASVEGLNQMLKRVNQLDTSDRNNQIQETRPRPAEASADVFFRTHKEDTSSEASDNEEDTSDEEESTQNTP